MSGWSNFTFKTMVTYNRTSQMTKIKQGNIVP